VHFNCVFVFCCQADGDLLGNGNDSMVLSADDATPSKMEDTHQTYLDMFVGSASDADASHEDVDGQPV